MINRSKKHISEDLLYPLKGENYEIFLDRRKVLKRNK